MFIFATVEIDNDQRRKTIFFSSLLIFRRYFSTATVLCFVHCTRARFDVTRNRVLLHVRRARVFLNPILEIVIVRACLF